VSVPRDPDNEATDVRGPDARVVPGAVLADPAEVDEAPAAEGSRPERRNGVSGAAGARARAQAPQEAQAPAALRATRSIGGAVVTGVKDAAGPAVKLLENFGEHLILVGRALAWLPRRPVRMANYVDAAEFIGFGSLPIVLLVGAFTGMVMSLQSVYAFRPFGLESFSGGTTGKALSTELGPVLTSLMLAGRAGAGMATELGTMRITEQIDALESMAVNPIQYLVLPRLISAMIVTPILALLFFVVGMGGAWLVAVVFQGVDQGQWIANVRDIVDPIDVLQGLIKGVFFGFLVSLVGCYQGFHASGGGRGVGMGTTRAVVIASVTTLVIDYFLSAIMLVIFRSGSS
jgi:phospholipid/cholesterol/gamma-HCH transport system permease protein